MAMMSAMAEDQRLRIVKRTHEGRQIARQRREDGAQAETQSASDQETSFQTRSTTAASCFGMRICNVDAG
jgi:DNA invertase Pin-like site-specific DNA recombinase